MVTESDIEDGPNNDIIVAADEYHALWQEVVSLRLKVDSEKRRSAALADALGLLTQGDWEYHTHDATCIGGDTSVDGRRPTTCNCGGDEIIEDVKRALSIDAGDRYISEKKAAATFANALTATRELLDILEGLSDVK
jgi:hypothetical protein